MDLGEATRSVTENTSLLQDSTNRMRNLHQILEDHLESLISLSLLIVHMFNSQVSSGLCVS